MAAPILSIIGKSGSGKTPLIEPLIPALKAKGYRVGTIKHHSHPGFEIDFPGKDTWRHARAGSDHVVIAAPDKIASIRNLEQELPIDEIAAAMEDVDLILTDGYKSAGKPAIEVIRAETGLEQIGDPGQVLVIASDSSIYSPIFQVNLNDIPAIIAVIEARLLRNY
jgi:molybdopterin-guanine dinucleotide biosynthesis protein B